MIWNDAADMSDMANEQLKSMVAAGRYKPDAAKIAEAMLSRRSVRELLTASEPLTRADRTRQTVLASRRAA
jgi:hypothetical protein